MSAPPRPPTIFPQSTFDHLGNRAAAFLVDLFVVMVIVIAAIQAAIGLDVKLPGWLFYTVAGLYFGILPATPLQGTLGKRMLGVRIADGAGRRIGLGRALLRLVAFVPSFAIAGAGLLLAAFTARRQALHDLMAGTFVVSRGATPDAIAQVPPPVSGTNRIVGGVVIAIGVLGIYQFLMIYNDRPKRGYAGTMILATEPFKTEVVKALQARAPMPAAASLPRYARAMSAQPDGTIVIDVADELFPGGRLMLRPASNAKGEVMWTCSSEKIQQGLLPAYCRTGAEPIASPRTPPPPQAPSRPPAPN